ncbi:MAG: hypothetical protein J6Y78_15115 [Paludibacteraceae bacterium]|nr:hypothetical protein [Paludibacteraceae bacterium]
MTLEEAIKRYKKHSECIQQTLITKEEAENVYELLRELQKWRALRDNINKLCDVDCEYPQYRESGTMCDACPIGTVKEYFEQIFGEEVNADDT